MSSSVFGLLSSSAAALLDFQTPESRRGLQNYQTSSASERGGLLEALVLCDPPGSLDGPRFSPYHAEWGSTWQEPGIKALSPGPEPLDRGGT